MGTGSSLVSATAGGGTMGALPSGTDSPPPQATAPPTTETTEAKEATTASEAKERGVFTARSINTNGRSLARRPGATGASAGRLVPGRRSRRDCPTLREAVYRAGRS